MKNDIQAGKSPVVQFTNVDFFYPPVPDEPEVPHDETAASNPDEINQVFHNLTIEVPAGITSLVGQNGTGKSTFMLLAGARLFPAAGTVYTMGIDTERFRNSHLDPEREEERNRLISLVYQNMEFETDAPIGELFEFVYENGYREQKPGELLQTIISKLELREDLHHKTQELSKGALQRAIIGFSLLYGSPLVIMDEPVFALEDSRKERVFQFVTEFARDDKISLLYSAHELHLSEKYSDNVMLFHKQGRIDVGPTEEMLQRERIEEAYQVPLALLYRKEQLYRETLQSSAGQ
ncbi:MAG: ATP-binding cassette domain-containing protein [Spirochaeta sp.]